MAKVSSLRHVDVAVPNFEEAVDFYGGVWGLTRVDGDKDIAFLAAEGSPEQYIYRIRKADEKRLDLIAFGADSPEDVDELAADLAEAGVRFVSEPGSCRRRAAATVSASLTRMGVWSRSPLAWSKDRSGR